MKISDSAVLKATGKVWIEWFALLDAAGASVLSHADIAEYLRRRHGVGDWWGQMVTVAYEQARGLRQKHQKPDGFAISVSKTLPVSVAVAFEHWYDTVQRSRWLADSAIKIRKATANKSMRIDWIDARTRLSLNFVPRGNDRSQVVVQHMKLPDSDAAARMKRYWYDQLEKLNALLAGADSTPASPNAGSMNIPMD